LSTEGDAAEGVEEMYGATERRLVFSIIKAQSLRAQKRILRQAIFWERYEAANLAYLELKRSHELANEHSPH
jgi:hypothetical protein